MASRDKKDLRPELVQVYEKAFEVYSKLYPNEPQPFITCTYRSDTLSINDTRMVQNTRTNNGKEEQEKYPQVCMVIPRVPECKRLKLPNIKKLKQLA